MEVKILKLITGEEIVASCELAQGNYRINQPMRLVPTEQGLGMFPWLITKDENFTIDSKNVVLVYSPVTELVNGYKQRVGGIVTASAGALNQLNKLQI